MLLPEKALSLILATPSGITVLPHPAISILVDVSIKALQSFLLSYTLLSLSTTIDFKLEHLPNTISPIFSTEAGIHIEERPEHPSNALAPIETIVFGIVTEVIPVQP